MLKGKRKTQDPCPTCQMHRQRCICALIPSLDLKTKITLVIHAKELKRTTNTGRLALHVLKNSEMHVRGEGREALDLSPLLTSEYESYVLFPSDDAVELDTIRPIKPVQLFVADGNWRQAGKLHTRQRELKHLPRVKISAKNQSSLHLRKEHFEEGMSTIEAIASALKVLEGQKVYESLLALYHAKLHATLEGRGVLGVNAHL